MGGVTQEEAISAPTAGQKVPGMRRALIMLQETFVPSLLVALLSGVIASSCGTIVLVFLQLDSNMAYHPGGLATLPRARLTWWDLRLLPALPILGAIGSIVFWRVTLPFGLISALAQHFAGPSRRLSVTIGAFYGGLWATTLQNFNPVTGHTFDVDGKSWGLHPSFLNVLGPLLLFAVVGAVVGLLMPWRYLLRSWWRTAR